MFNVIYDSLECVVCNKSRNVLLNIQPGDNDEKIFQTDCWRLRPVWIPDELYIVTEDYSHHLRCLCCANLQCPV